MWITATRRADLDWLRVAAFGLLILYHVGMAFVTWDWHVKTAHPSDTLEPFMVLLNPWRLSLLFFVSGCATSFMATRITGASLAWRRLGRLGLPLLFGMLVIVPPQSWVQVREHGFLVGYGHFYAQYLTAYRGYCDAHGCLILPTWNHLWFVAYLLVYTMLLAAVLATFPRLRTTPHDAATAPGAWFLGAVLTIPAVWLVFTSVVLRHRFPETHALAGDWYAHALYLPVFLLGFAIAKYRPFWQAAVRLRFVALAGAGAAYSFIALLYILYPGDAVPPDGMITAYRYVYGIDQWMWMLALLGFAHCHLHRGGKALNYLTQGVFPFYIVHQTIIVLTEYWLKGVGLPAWAEFAVLVVVTAAGCLLSYEIVRRVALLRPLFGLRSLAREVRVEGKEAVLF